MPRIDADNMPDFLRAYGERTPYALGWREGMDFTGWKAKGLAAAKAAVNGDLDALPAVETIAVRPLPGGALHHLELTFPTGAGTHAVLALPPGEGPHPAIVLLHDHGGKFDIGWQKLLPAEPGPARDEGDAWIDQYYDNRYLGLQLLERGYAVMAWDALGWGSRKGNGLEAQQALASNLMQYGLSLAGLMAQEDVQATNLLASWPGIDARAIGAWGFSMGGYRAWQLAALSPRIVSAVSSCWMAAMKPLMAPGNNQLSGQSAFNMLHPALGGRLDYPDFAGLAAPKPMLFEAGARDHLFSEASIREAFSGLEAIWAAAGASDRLITKVWDRGHILLADQQALAFDFLSRTLRAP